METLLWLFIFILEAIVRGEFERILIFMFMPIDTRQLAILTVNIRDFQSEKFHPTLYFISYQSRNVK